MNSQTIESPVESRKVQLHTAFIDERMARAIWGLRSRQISAQIEDGRIPWAFDLSVSQNRKFIRIPLCAVDPATRADMADIMDALMGSAAWITATDLADQLNVDNGHVHNLILAGLLEASTGHRGPGGSPRVTRQSLRALLENRRVL